MRNASGVSLINKMKTHCIHGHSFISENTYFIRKDGIVIRRGCKTCHKEYYQRNKKRIRDKNLPKKKELNKYNRDRYKKERNLCLDHYGRVCSICGSEKKLCIDHIDGKGYEKQGCKDLYMYLIKNNFPPGFRTLCFSCNIIDGFLRNHENLKIDGMNDLVTRLKDLAKFREKEFLQMATELTRLKVEHERLQERHNLVSDKLWKLQKGGEKDEEKIF